VQSLLAQTANLEAPNEVNVSQPSDALEELGRRDPRRGVVGRHRLGHPDRRVRWPDMATRSTAHAEAP
jgi:hypothetical protein